MISSDVRQRKYCKEATNKTNNKLGLILRRKEAGKSTHCSHDDESGKLHVSSVVKLRLILCKGPELPFIAGFPLATTALQELFFLFFLLLVFAPAYCY